MITTYELVELVPLNHLLKSRVHGGAAEARSSDPSRPRTLRFTANTTACLHAQRTVMQTTALAATRRMYMLRQNCIHRNSAQLASTAAVEQGRRFVLRAADSFNVQPAFAGTTENASKPLDRTADWRMMLITLF